MDRVSEAPDPRRPTCRHGRAVGCRVVLLLGAACYGRGGGPSTAPRAESDLLSQLREHNHVGTFQAEAVLDVFLPDGARNRGHVLVSARLPDQLLIVAERAGTPRWEISCGGGALTFVDHVAHCYSSKPCDPSWLSGFLGVPFAPHDLLAIMTGTTPIVAGADRASESSGESGRVVLEMRGTTERQSVEIDGSSTGQFDVAVSAARSDSVESWRIVHEDFSTQEGDDGSKIRLPARTRIVAAGNDVLIGWEARRLEIELSDEAFTLQPPRSYSACP